MTVPWSLAFRAAWTLLGVETWAVSGWPRFPAVFVFFTSFDIHVFPSRAIVSGLIEAVKLRSKLEMENAAD